MDTYPLISCICITKNRTTLLQRAIKCFEIQSYPNKEMIIVFESDNIEAKEMLMGFNNKSIKAFEVSISPKKTLGELRNLAIEASEGSFFCQWDDDDWYSTERLLTQYLAISQNRKECGMLLYWIMYDCVNKQAYLSPLRLWEGSILCRKSLINHNFCYGNLSKGEDTILLKKLIGNNCIFPIIQPNIYIYTFHGKNTWDYNHFNKYFTTGKPLSEGLSKIVNEILSEKISVLEGTEILQSDKFLKEINYSFKFINDYELQLC